MKFKKLVALALAFAFAMTFSASTLDAWAADFTAFEVTDTIANMNGTDDCDVTVTWRAKSAQTIYNVEGFWDLTEQGETEYLKLKKIESTVLNLTGMNYGDAATGKVLWTDTTFSAPAVLAANDVILIATYTVKADTPAGDYKVQYNSKSLTGDDWEPDTTAKAFEATIKVVAAPVPVTGVSVADLSLNVGETKTLSWSVTPENATNKDVTFLVNEPEVIELNQTTGEVKGLKEGTATVTVVTNDGSFHDTCTVTVSCGHTAKTDIAEKASTCKEKGWDAYKKCADCEQLFDASGNKIDAIPYRALSTEHTEGTPANCVNQAVCSVCGEAYGEPTGVHNFTKENAVPERLASPATCQNPAKYYYSCAVCGVSENNADRVFESGNTAEHVYDQEKVGKDYLDNAATCTSKATYFKSCVCGRASTTETFETGEMLPHTYSVEKAEPKYLATAATCTAKATYYKSCSCGAFSETESSIFKFGATAEHKFEKKIETNAYIKTESTSCQKGNEYWYACTTCDAKSDTKYFESATNKGPHKYDQTVEDDEKYLKEAGANCQTAYSYYKSCVCGAKGSEVFSSTTKFGDHNVNTAKWEHETVETVKYHYHACSVSGCDYKTDRAACAGGTATCVAPAVCATCQTAYGTVSTTHAFDKENYEKSETQHWHKCTVSGCTATTEKKSHVPGAAPTEDNPQKCTVCDYVIQPALGHQCKLHLTAVPAKEPNCTETGNIAYWLCECTKMYKDAEAKEEVTNVTIPAKGHKKTHVPAKSESCTEDGNVEYWFCSVCKKNFADEACTTVLEKVVIEKHHTLEKVAAVAANCKNPGNKEHWKCIVVGCAKLFSDDKGTTETTADSVVLPVDPNAHIWDEGKVTKEPTTEAEGEKTFTCTVEGCGVTKTEPIAKLDNKPVITPVGPNPKPQKPTEPTEPAKPAFGDVAGEWFEADVEYVAKKGLMNGVGDGSMFAPLMNTSRGMIVTILWRMEGQPVPKAPAAFTDVEKGAYYEQAVAWASENGIVNGYGATFGPNDNITREQFATILFRYAQFKGYDVSVGEDTNILSYADAFSISEYAIPAMQWACGAGLINGIGDTLQPAGAASRAQAAAILHRFCENVIQ